MAFLYADLIEIRPSKFGRGVFAKTNIPAHTIICPVTGPELNFSDTILLGDRESHSLQIDIDKYILCDPPFLFSNHSCNPNCAVSGELNFYTLKDIKADEELLWDYSTSMLERHWQMPCACGSADCRKLVRDFDLIPVNLQQQYINMNIVLPFILKNNRYQQDEYVSRA